ncbi:MAG TPA: T9SS type A sorting domain-containing protein, partial [Chitinophagales bacterium]|nr:T9SS type A sorting domain-containing protein [Chitinophagales bacterium]
SYTVTATDANGCTATAQATITEPTSINISVTANNAACGQNNGSASASVSGGTAGYNYSWSNSATTLSISALGAGNYAVTVTDNAGCTATAVAIVNNTGSPVVGSSAVNATCFGAANGSAQVNVSSGTPPYTYQWSNGAVTSSINNITAGTYTATVTDGAGCLSVITQVVTEPTSLSVTTSSTLATCGANNGTAVATVTGGTQGYTFVWNDNSTADELSNLTAGTYYVTVTDANNCTGTGTALVNSASSIVATIAATNISCNGAANGTAGVNIASAQQPVTYAWSNGETTASLTNLAPGTVTVTITDGNNCPAIQQITITEPDALTVTQTVVSPRCYGDNNGSVDITATGGTVPYTFEWSGNNAVNLTAGTYTTTVTDAAGCSVTAIAVLTDPAPLALTTTAVNVICSGAQNGSATVNVTGGTGDYEYLWSNFNSTPTVQNLPGGNYTIQVSDSNGCTATATVTVDEADPIQFATATTNANIGAADGGVQVTNPTGGTAPFTFAWNTGDTTQNLTATAGGTYSVTVTDSNGCTETATVIVQENPNSVSVLAEEFSFSICPNPAYNQVLVAVSKTGTNTTISIKNILGQQLYIQNLHSTTTNIDLSLFAAGVYMLELNTGERKLVKELVIGR